MARGGEVRLPDGAADGRLGIRDADETGHEIGEASRQRLEDAPPPGARGGAGQQQVRNVWASVSCFNINGWLYSAVERWSWEQPQEECK